MRLFQSTHLLRGATAIGMLYCVTVRYFNPRTSCEVRHGLYTHVSAEITFQSTHLLRGATSGFLPLPARSRYFNPRTSCEVRQQNYTKEFIFSSSKLFSVKFCVQALTSKLAYIFKTSKTTTFSNANLTEKNVHFHFAISSIRLQADILAWRQIPLFSFHNYFQGNKNANYLFPD